MKEILWEVRTFALESNRVKELIQVIRELEDVKVIKILGYKLAWIVDKVQWIHLVSTKIDMQEVAVLLQKNLVNQGDESNIDH